MRVSVIIPARMAATRFPGKPLAKILGKPMIQWVCERASQSHADEIWVATDSTEIAAAVSGFGGKVMLTSSSHRNGTQRIAEAAQKIRCDLVINVQGDEPAISPQAINQVIAPLREQPQVQMTTLAEPMTAADHVFNPNSVKVVLDKNSHALYFSRAPIPYHKHPQMSGPTWPVTNHQKHLRHVGIYGFRKPFLLAYAAEPPCYLEETEGLEQLRALYMGVKIHVSITNQKTIGVDTPADIAKAEAFLRQRGS